jgi:branched-chain amino acid transport system permease protein
MLIASCREEASAHGALGFAIIGLLDFEHFIVRPVYAHHLKQILITMGGIIIG